MSELNNLIADLETAETKYKTYWVIPYANAYVEAHASFQGTLASQDEWNKFKLGLFLSAVTIGFGGGIGAMFGKTAVGGVVVDQALKVICNRNMTRAFNALAQVSNSVPASFVVEKAYETVVEKLGEKVKSQLEGLVTGQAAVGGITNPQIMQNDLESYVLKLKIAAADLCAWARDKFSPQLQELVAVGVRSAPFMAKKPEKDLIGDRGRAAKVMELGFYMVMVMDCDYLVETTIRQQGVRDSMRVKRLGQVTAATSDPKYASAVKSEFKYGPGYANTTTVGIVYERLGSKILDRINTLYSDLKLGDEFFPNGLFDFEKFGFAEVQRAEKTLEQLNDLVLRTPI